MVTDAFDAEEEDSSPRSPRSPQRVEKLKRPIDAERVEKLKQIFKELDTDGSGTVGIEELKKGLIRTKIIRSKLAAEELFHRVRAATGAQCLYT